MIGDLESNALLASQKYNGRIVEVEGYVSNIDAQGEYISLKSAPEAYDFSDIQAFITTSLQDKVIALQVGDKVTVTGMVTDVGEVRGYSIQTYTIE